MGRELKRKISDAIIYTISRALSLSDDTENEGKEEKSPHNGDLTGIPISVLDDPVILKIFRYLPRLDLLRAAAVCKHWHELSFDRSLWRNVDLKNYSKALMDGSRLQNLTESYLVAKVRALDLSGFTLTHIMLNTLANHCPELRKLVLKSASFQIQGDADDAVVLFPAQLKFLDVRYSHGNARIYKAISETLNGIKWLGICDGLILSLGNDEEVLKNVLDNLENLEKFDMSHCKLASDKLLMLLEKCSRLKVLCLRKCQNIHGEELDLLIPKLTSLETLILDGTSIDDKFLNGVNWERTNLRYLELGWCPFISTNGLKHLFPKVAQMDCLEYLGLCRVGEGRSLTDDNLKQFAISLSYGVCTSLNAVNFSMCNTITELGLRAFVRKYPKIQTVDASNCAGVVSFSCGSDSSAFRSKPFGRKISLSDTDIDENNNLPSGPPRRRMRSRGSFSTTQFALSKYALETPL